MSHVLRTLVLGAWLLASLSHAQAPQQKAQAAAPAKPVTSVRAQEASPQTVFVRDLREAVKEERAILAADAQRYHATLESAVRWILWGLGLLVVIALAMLKWALGQTRKETNEAVRAYLESDAKAGIDAEIKKVRAGIAGELSDITSAIGDLKLQLGLLADYQNRRVVWVVCESAWKLPEGAGGVPLENKRATATQKIVEALHSVGLKQIELLTPNTGDALTLGEPELVIFTYDKSEEGRRLLGIVVTALKEKTPPVFLIVDTYNPGGEEIRLEAPEREILKGFSWYVPANFPATIVAQTQLLVRKLPPLAAQVHA